MTLFRLIASAALIYAAVFLESKWCLAILLVFQVGFAECVVLTLKQRKDQP